MTLQSKFERELNQLGNGGAALLSVADGGHEIACDIAERNTLAVSFDRLALKTPRLQGASAVRLEQIAKALAERLTYLMEPISPIEIDRGACVVQMRSNPPQRDDDGRSYYEVLVRGGGEIALRRFRKENGTSRQAIAANVTREVLLRLVGDFCVVLG